jgi:periplasmic divalent cation tolerance protein
MTDKKIVLTTTGSPEEARKIAEELLSRELAACVNIVPGVTSIYKWQGKMQRDQEYLLIIKTTGAAFLRVRDAIKELHSYEVPECIALNIEDGLPEYLDWLQGSVRAV